MSTEVNLTFAMTIHETQGQTLNRAILLLGRQRGVSVGNITWDMLYVALSGTKKISHLRFFPSSGGIKDFNHLIKLKASSTFTKWSESYINHRWDPDHLRKKHFLAMKAVNKELKLLGREKTFKQTNVVLRGYLSRLGCRKLGSAKRPELQWRLNKYMVEKNLWKRQSSKPLHASIEGKQIDEAKSNLKSTGGTKIPKPGTQNVSTGKNKKKGVSEKKVSSKIHKKQKQKHQIPWLLDTNLKLFEIGDDGNCLFRAMSHQLYGTEEYHDIIRKRCCDYIQLERNYFRMFIANIKGTLNISDYLKNMRKDRIWGGNLELMAFAELYRKTIHVYRSGPTPDHIFGYGYSEVQQEEPIRLHFRSGNHYESLLSHNASQFFLVD